MERLLFIVLIIFLTSCTADFGNQVQGGNLTVYYTSTADKQMAQNVAQFWKEEGLLTDQPQYLQLVETQGAHALKIIAKDPTSVKEISFEERKLLSDLQQQLQTALGDPYLQVLICNGQFEPIYNMNE